MKEEVEKGEKSAKKWKKGTIGKNEEKNKIKWGKKG